MIGTSTATTSSAPAPTFDQIRASMECVMRDIPRELFAAFMDKRGMPPEKGYVLILPERLRAQVPLPPRYVRFSALGEQALIVHMESAIGFATPSRVSQDSHAV